MVVSCCWISLNNGMLHDSFKLSMFMTMTQYDSKTVLYMQHSHNTRVIQYIHCTCNIALTYVLTVFLIFFFRTFKYIERELPKVPKHIPVLVLVSKYFLSIVVVC